MQWNSVETGKVNLRPLEASFLPRLKLWFYDQTIATKFCFSRLRDQIWIFSDRREQNSVFPDFVDRGNVSATNAIEKNLTATRMTEITIIATGATEEKLNRTGATKKIVIHDQRDRRKNKDNRHDQKKIISNQGWTTRKKSLKIFQWS